MGMFDDFFDGVGDLGCIAGIAFIIISPLYYAFKLVFKFLAWVSDKSGIWIENAFRDKEP